VFRSRAILYRLYRGGRAAVRGGKRRESERNTNDTKSSLERNRGETGTG
jgi:hypothetical protein